MSLLAAAISFLLVLGLALAGVSRVGAWLIERDNPPVGRVVTVNDTGMHHVHVPAGANADLPALVFIHGASGNLLDQMVPIRPLLEGRAQMLFMDRPGHGWSERGTDNDDPAGQARTIAALMEHYDIADAIVIGHSFGGAVAATLALEKPEKVRGLVFLSPATHPWPGGETSWYYKVAAMPALGRMFAETLAWPGGMLRLARASEGVFSPNRKPDAYETDAGIRLVLRPRAFRWNAIDVAGLHAHVTKAASHYREIAAPTVVISGNRDTVVYEELHSWGLARDIPGAELVWIDNLGHKPNWVAPELVAAAIEKIAGLPADLEAAARAVEARIAPDAFGPVEPAAGDPEFSPAG